MVGACMQQHSHLAVAQGDVLLDLRSWLVRASALTSIWQWLSGSQAALQWLHISLNDFLANSYLTAQLF